MNNAQIVVDLSLSPIERDVKPTLRKREEKLIRTIEAIRAIAKTEDWSTLKIELFDELVSSLERDLRNEAKKEDVNLSKLQRLAGQLKWAERYADLTKLEEKFKLELTALRTNLYGTEHNG